MDIARKTTNGVTISVTSKFEEQMAQHSETPFNFSYFIEIYNESEFTLQLMRREWRIFDTFGSVKQISGEGVVGEQPIILPGGKFQYSSWCGLFSPLGNMSGSYEMVDVKDEDHVIKVSIPKFVLCVDFIKN